LESPLFEFLKSKDLLKAHAGDVQGEKKCRKFEMGEKQKGVIVM